jgi:hypothetical protein
MWSNLSQNYWREIMMGDKYPFYHPLYVPNERRTMKEVKADYNKNLQKHSLSKVNKRK